MWKKKRSRKTASKVAERVAAFFHEKFGGKAKGKFRISYKDMLLLTGAHRLSSKGYVEQIEEFLCENYGIVMVEVGDDFVFLGYGALINVRKVPKRLIVNSEDESEKENSEPPEDTFGIKDDNLIDFDALGRYTIAKLRLIAGKVGVPSALIQGCGRSKKNLIKLINEKVR